MVKLVAAFSTGKGTYVCDRYGSNVILYDDVTLLDICGKCNSAIYQKISDDVPNSPAHRKLAPSAKDFTEFRDNFLTADVLGDLVNASLRQMNEATRSFHKNIYKRNRMFHNMTKRVRRVIDGTNKGDILGNRRHKARWIREASTK